MPAGTVSLDGESESEVSSVLCMMSAVRRCPFDFLLQIALRIQKKRACGACEGCGRLAGWPPPATRTPPAAPGCHYFNRARRYKPVINLL